MREPPALVSSMWVPLNVGVNLECAKGKPQVHPLKIVRSAKGAISTPLRGRSGIYQHTGRARYGEMVFQRDPARASVWWRN